MTAAATPELRHIMKSLFLGTAVALALGAAAPALAAPKSAGPDPALVSAVDIPYERFTLANGLRVIVHTDRKAPIIATSIWYHVGSKDEPAGKTGFAHLFEHLMFNGTENYNHDWFVALQEMGATSYNGTTWFDRTNYFQNVPTPGLERILFLESDRMGHLLGAIDQTKLTNQIGVVQNEKRQGDNQPFGKTEYRILEGLFPEGHPYRHSTIGSMADLSAASLEDVKTWFRTWYGPNNAVLVLAGDIDAATAKPLVEKYFGDLPAGPAVERRLRAWVPERSETVRETMEDQVSNTRIYRVWAVPGLNDADAQNLSIAAATLGGGNSSRLYKDLVRDKQLAIGVSGYLQPFEAVSLLQIEVDVKPGVNADTVNARLDQLLADFLAKGPTKDEVGRVAMRAVSGTIRGLEAVGGFGGKAVTLAEGELYSGDPHQFKKDLSAYVNATPASVQDAAKRWISKGDYQLTVYPYGALQQVAGKGIDRSKLPPVDGAPALEFPAVERAKLSNGIEVVFAKRDTVPVVNLSMVFDAGNAADARDKLGTQSLMLSLLDEGTTKRTAIQIAEEEERLGANIGASAGNDTTEISLSALTTNLAPSLDLWADIIRNPKFDPAELERVRGIQIAGIAQEESQPQTLALRLLPPLIYGTAHPYGVPLTGSGTVEGVKAVTRSDLVSFHQTWLRPDNATIFASGATSIGQLVPLLEKAVGTWSAPSTPKGMKTFTTATAPAASKIILIDRPGSPQSFILAGYPLAHKGTDDNLALTTVNTPLGGVFTSRLNMNLREDKGWSYGVSTAISQTSEQMPFYVFAPVQADKTGAALTELRKDITAYVTDKPITPEEMKSTLAFLTGRLPGAYESSSAVLDALQTNARLKRPDDYQVTYAAKLNALSREQLAAAAKANIDVNKLLWVVVGDRRQVEPQLKTLGLPIEVK
ncbi:MAG: pitrilysin family protein [Pseudomonadota bacterium]|jgi:zinc protease|nr:pitrilysin family protein [Pseudomonadota bacterium]